MKITEKWLQEKKACEDSLSYVIKNNYVGLSAIDFIQKLMSEGRFSDANWLIVRVMNKKQKVQYAIFSAEQAIDIYEKKYPNNKAPRLAIKAAKNYLKNPCKQTKEAADVAGIAASAAYTAACAAESAASASYTAACAAESAASASYTAACATSDTAAYIAADTAADATTKKEFKIKIINNGLKLLMNK